MRSAQIFSADSHVVEPADVWTSRMDARFRDRAPHIIKEANGIKGDFFVCEGLQPSRCRPLPLPGLTPEPTRTR